jgi:hypothetical protein
MVCPCCAPGCENCPDYCSFDLAIECDDTVGTNSITLDRGSCTGPCSDAVTDTATFGSDSVTVTASYGGGGVTGFGRADESTSSGGVAYTRASSISVTVTCDAVTKKWELNITLVESDSQNTDPFYSGIGFQKKQSLDLVYSIDLELGCADKVNLIEIEANGSGATVDGTFHNWSVVSYSETCEELDGSLVYQPCADYLSANVPTVTFTFSRRAGC